MSSTISPFPAVHQYPASTAGGMKGSHLPSVRPTNRGSNPGSRTDVASSAGRTQNRIDGKGRGRVGKATHEKRGGAVQLDPASYRNSKSHNLCVQLIEEGYHESFVELFQLFKRQQRRRSEAEPGSKEATEPLIENDSLKLDQMRTNLTAAEDSKRMGDLDAVYMCQRSLAQYFDQTGDVWVSDHFHESCLQTSLLIKEDGRRKEGEAHCNIGLSLENRGKLVAAVGHLEMFYHLARKHKWHTDSGEGLHEISCEHLRRVYTKMAEKDGDSVIELLTKALEMSKESGDSYQEGLAHYRLGLGYEEDRDLNQAIKCYKSYFERCKFHGDTEGMGTACRSMAKIHEQCEEFDKAVEWLELFVELSEKGELNEKLAEACKAIGMLHNTLGDFGRACKFFEKCHTLYNQLCLKEEEIEARAHYGIASAHLMFEKFSNSLQTTDPGHVEAIVEWKENRHFSEQEEDQSNDLTT